MGVCGRLVRPQSPIPLFPLYVPSWTPGRPGGHSLSPAASLWPALLGRVLWMTASSIRPNSTAAGTKHHRHLASALLNPELPVERAFCDSAFRSRESVYSIGVGFPSVWLSLDLAIFGDIPAPCPCDLHFFGLITPFNPIGLIECNSV